MSSLPFRFITREIADAVLSDVKSLPAWLAAARRLKKRNPELMRLAEHTAQTALERLTANLGSLSPELAHAFACEWYVAVVVVHEAMSRGWEAHIARDEVETAHESITSPDRDGTLAIADQPAWENVLTAVANALMASAAGHLDAHAALRELEQLLAARSDGQAEPKANARERAESVKEEGDDNRDAATASAAAEWAASPSADAAHALPPGAVQPDCGERTH